MKVKYSQFLSDNKHLVKEIVLELEKSFEYVSVLGVDTSGKTFNVSKRGSGINDSMWSERGFVVRVFNGEGYSEYSFNELDVSKVVKKVKSIALTDFDLEKNAYPLVNEDEFTESMQNEVEINLDDISAEEKLNKLSMIMSEGLKLSDKLLDFRVGYEEVHISKMFLSSKKDLNQSLVYSTASIMPIVKEKDVVKYAHKGYSGLKGVEILDEIKDIEKTVEFAVSLLDAEKVVPGEYEIICDPDVAGLIAHEAFGHGVEMDMFVKNRAQGQEFIGKEVASKKVSMKDGALSAREVGTYLFDDEGTLGSDTLIINESILESGISDLLSALKLGTTPTGNGRRESYERKAYARMTNTFFVPGEEKLEDMIASIKKGYLLEGFDSGMEDPKNWGIQCMLSRGKEIIDGKFTGKVIAPVLMTGYVPDLLKSITMISDGLELSGGGACGKGHKEWVKTSTGGTHIKAVGRLG